MPSRPLQLFISHVHEERVLAHAVKALLKDKGIDSFVAHDDIPGSAPWRKEIIRNLQECDAVALFLHDGFKDSKFCDQETGIAYGLEKKLIPVQFSDTTPWGFADEFQGHRCQGASAEVVAREVFSALAEDEEMAKRVGLAVIYALGRARSYEQAIERAKRVRRTVRAWDEELYEALETTLENSQVSNSASRGR